MSSGKSASKLGNANRQWNHTMHDPTIVKNKGKFALAVGYYSKLSDRKQKKRKFSCDGEFSSEFGLYSSEVAAAGDITKFREAVDFQNERKGQGGGRNITDHSFASPERKSLRVMANSAEKDDTEVECKAAIDRMVGRLEMNDRKFKLRMARYKKEKTFCGSLRTARSLRMQKFLRRRHRHAAAFNKTESIVSSLQKMELLQADWRHWRNKVIKHLDDHQRKNTEWKLLDCNVKDQHSVSSHQLALVRRKTAAVKKILMTVNKQLDMEIPTMNAKDCAVVAGEYAACSWRSVYNYYLEYKLYEDEMKEGRGMFSLDTRGKYQRDWVLNEEDYLQKFIKNMQTDSLLSVDRQAKFVNNKLFADPRTGVIDMRTLEKHGLKLPLSDLQVWRWMKRAGGVVGTYEKHYYNDMHNDPKVVESRSQYIDIMDELEQRQHLWIRKTQSEVMRLREDNDLFPSGLQCDGAMEEFHLDVSEQFDVEREKLLYGGCLPEKYTAEARLQQAGDVDGPAETHSGEVVKLKPPPASWSCKFGHSYVTCKCHLPIYHVGQDESIYKAYAKSKKVWITRGVTGLRKKSDGPGEMVSAVQDNIRGFGLPMSKHELDTFKNERSIVSANAAAVKVAHAAVFSVHALIWNVDVETAEADVQAALTYTAPVTSPADEDDINKRISAMLTQDEPQSPGVVFLNYGKGKEGYWNYSHFEMQMLGCIIAIEVLYPFMQLLVEVDHSSGHGKAQEGGLNVNSMSTGYGGKQAQIRTTTIIEGCLGDGDAIMWTHHGKFSLIQESPEWTKVDLKLELGQEQRMNFQTGDPPPFYKLDAPRTDTIVFKQTRKKGNVANKQVVVQGYEGKPKGMQQILWERGLWKEGMIKAVSDDDKKGRGQDLSMVHTLSMCADFQKEVSAFQKLVTDRGHILVTSPKGHPELAGVGVEYSWGGSKLKFRRENDCQARNLHKNILNSFRVLTKERVRKYARKARSYRSAYRKIRATATTVGARVGSFLEVEKFVKESKIHRCILNQEKRYLQLSLLDA